MRIRIGVERNHTVLLLYVSVYILSTFFFENGYCFNNKRRGPSPSSNVHFIFNLQNLSGPFHIRFIPEGKPKDPRHIFPALDNLDVAQIDPLLAEYSGNLTDDAGWSGMST